MDEDKKGIKPIDLSKGNKDVKKHDCDCGDQVIPSKFLTTMIPFFDD